MHYQLYFYKDVFLKCLQLCLIAVMFLTVLTVAQTEKIMEKKPHQVLSLEKSKVYGPGLYSNFSVPVRYFFIELLDVDQKSFIPEIENLVVQVAGLKQKCRLWDQLLHIRNGLFVSRFRLYESCQGLRIDITYKDKHVAESPYIIEGVFVHEHCYCPKPMEDWLLSLACPSNYQQIIDDLEIFSNIDMRNVLQDALKRFNQPGAYSICHYAIIDNQINRKCYGQYVGFSMFMDEILLSLARKVHLPDLEMLVNLGDWPLEQRKISENPIPIFSWCGSKTTRDIVMPTYDITESTLEMMGRVMLDILSAMGNSGPVWNEKEKIAFWRGRDSRQERLDLIKLARRYPQKINASLTNFFFYRKEEEEYGPKAEYISFFDFFKYRHQINIDGTVAAYRMPYLLAGGSLVLKQDSDFYEHFYRELQPMIHYVPFYRNLSNLIEVIDWAMMHDNEAETIANNAQNFVLDKLLPKDIFCYYSVLLNEFSKKLIRKPEITEGMERLSQPAQKSCLCLKSDKHAENKDEL